MVEGQRKQIVGRRLKGRGIFFFNLVTLFTAVHQIVCKGAAGCQLSLKEANKRKTARKRTGASQWWDGGEGNNGGDLSKSYPVEDSIKTQPPVILQQHLLCC